LKENSKQKLYSTGRNFLSQKENSCDRKKLLVTRRNLQSREETSCDRKKSSTTVKNLLSQEETSCLSKKHLKIDILLDEYNAEEEKEIADNVPLLQNAYQIFKNTMNNHWKEDNGDWHFIRKQGQLLINTSSRVIDRLLKEKPMFGFMDK
jgi:hypothetical protein